MIKKTILLFCISFTTLYAKAQDTDTSNIESKFPSISVGSGVLTFNGDIGKGVDVSNYSHIRLGYHLNVEKRINASFGVALNALYGKLAHSERSVMPERNLNFESTIIHTGLSAVYHIDNNYILKRNSVIGPYASLGFAFLKFNPKGDLLDDKGNPYHYWTDGSIRDLPESQDNLFSSNIVRRDHTYETQLKDSTRNYPRSTFVLPLTIGSRFQLNDSYEASIGATYNLAFSDYMDNLSGGKGNDAYFYFSFSITYNFPLKIIDAPAYKGVDFENIALLDADKDGVPDEKDMCLGTPAGVDVNKEGCPLDDDNDGVPNYLDKQPNSQKGSVVDADGVTITDEAAAKTLDDYTTKALGRTNLDFEFGDYDKDDDGYMSPEEMRTAMDDFFAGKSDYTIEKFQRLVQFFVRQ